MREEMDEDVGSLDVGSPSKDLSFLDAGYGNERKVKKRRAKRDEDSGFHVEHAYQNVDVSVEGNIHPSKSELIKHDRKKEKKKKQKSGRQEVEGSLSEQEFEGQKSSKKEEFSKMFNEDDVDQKKKKKKKKKEKSYTESGSNVKHAYQNVDVSVEGNIDPSKSELIKNDRKKEKKKKKSEGQEVEGRLIEQEFEGQKSSKKEEFSKLCNGDGVDLKKKKKKKKEKSYENSGDIATGKSMSGVEEVGDGNKGLDVTIDMVESSKKERKKAKKKERKGLEHAGPKFKVMTLENNTSQVEGVVVDTDFEDEAGDGQPEVNAVNAEVENKEKKRKRKRDKRGGDLIINSGTANSSQVEGNVFNTDVSGDETEAGDGEQEVNALNREVDSIDERKKKKRKRDKCGDDVVINRGTDEKDAINKRDCMDGNVERSKMGENEDNAHSTSKSERLKMKKSAVNLENGNKVKRSKTKSVKSSSEGEGSKRNRSIKGQEEGTVPSEKCTSKGTSKRVTFSEDVEVFPLSDAPSDKKAVDSEQLVRGKRFTPEEDEKVKEAVFNFINAHGLGEEGINMILNCKKHSQIRYCWKEIGAALPWRPYQSVYYRAHNLFERDENRKWTPEEYELVRRFHEKHGSDWRTLADALGKHRFHVKDTWRRIKLPNMKKGRWTQEEYQALFDLVNMDLRMKASEVKKTKHGMLRDNISWTAISTKLETRTDALCCQKWYDQLTSPMVAEGKWLDTDDYRLLNELYDLDACCMEDVDWDSLLEHRSGDICRKRWNQMVRHLGEHGNKSFPEQVEVLINRYCPDVLEAREAYNSNLEVD